MWSELEPVLDKQYDAETSHSSQEQGKVVDLLEDEACHQKTDIFERGIGGAAPDVLDRVTESQPDLKSGVLLSRYRILHLLGSGGMGDVYLAERADGQIDMQVAIKILSRGLSSPEFQARFQRERQILAELNHPGIASLLDAGITDDGRPWFVLDYIQGEPLISFCKYNMLSQSQRLRIFLKICEAIGYAHQCGVVHRDLKPGNILVKGGVSNPKPVVLDFGIASKSEDEQLTQTGQVLGTVSYSSPEQIIGDRAEIDQRSDIFSLGILLYELVDNRKPFRGNNSTETSYQIIHRDTPLLSSRHVQQDLSAIIFKCLQKAPSERYQSVSELISDLQNFKQGRSVSAHSVGSAYMLKRWIRRRPYLSTTIFLLIVLVTVLISTAIWQSLTKYEFAAKQALMTQHFEQVAQEIESGVQLVYSRPLHNIENDLAGFHQKYDNLKLQASQIDSASQPFVNYALGRAALDLGKNREALQFLKNAWDAGFKDTRLALKLGHAYIHNYSDSIHQISLLSYSEAQIAALDNAKKNYLQPARQFLQISTSADKDQALIAIALTHHLDNDTASALKLLKAVAEKSSWPVNAMLETGNLYLEIAEKKLIESDFSSAREALKQAENVFSETTRIARSHPDSMKGWCVALSKMIQLENLDVDEQPINQLKPIEPCDSLIKLNPHSEEALVYSGMAYLNTARYIHKHSSDPVAALDKATELSNKALQINPQYPQALSLLGSTHMTRSSWVYETGGDGELSLNLAIEALGKAADLTPGDSELIEELAQVLLAAGRKEYSRGGDGGAALAKGIDLLRDSLAKPGAPMSSLLQLSDNLTWHGYYLYNSGIDAQSHFQEAIQLAEQVLDKVPDHMQAIRIIALALSTSAELKLFKGEDPGDLPQQALNYFQRYIDIDPQRHVPRFNQLGALSLAVNYALDQGISQSDQLKKMHQLMTELEALLDNAHETNLLWADYWRYKAKQELIDKLNPAIEISTARHFLQKSLASKIDRYEAVQSFAALSVFEHQWRMLEANEDSALYAKDFEDISATIDEYPNLPVLRLWRAKLFMLSPTLDSEEKIKAAREDYSVAIQNNSLLANRFAKIF